MRKKWIYYSQIWSFHIKYSICFSSLLFLYAFGAFISITFGFLICLLCLCSLHSTFIAVSREPEPFYITTVYRTPLNGFILINGASNEYRLRYFPFACLAKANRFLIHNFPWTESYSTKTQIEYTNDCYSSQIEMIYWSISG